MKATERRAHSDVTGRADGKCEIDGCDRARKSRIGDQRVCLMHYKRWKKHGDASVVKKPWSPPNLNKHACSVAGCETKEDGASGMCKKHGTRMRRHGDPLAYVPYSDRNWRTREAHPQWAGDSITYAGAHQRVRAQRGPASRYACVDCGGRARHWSYDRRDPNVVASEHGPYSTDVTYYEPRCVTCHKAFDLEAIREGR